MRSKALLESRLARLRRASAACEEGEEDAENEVNVDASIVG